MRARTGAEQAACPACGTLSSRVHSRYVRRLADSAVGGRPVLIMLQVLGSAAVNALVARRSSPSRSTGSPSGTGGEVPVCRQSSNAWR
ncbi:transposase family protein [Streptomyces viridochromogenes]|uniref:transposase family protein n=1 Tax=Streptomyces viridochromogenes TaxID=1938 RepID=UPI003CC7F1E1